MTPVENPTMQFLKSSTEVTVFRPCGHINASNALEWRQTLVNALASHACRSVLVDMSQVESLDSAGLMAFVSALGVAQRRHRNFALCSVSPSIRIIFELTQLDQVFQIVPEQSAFLAPAA